MCIIALILSGLVSIPFTDSKHHITVPLCTLNMYFSELSFNGGEGHGCACVTVTMAGHNDDSENRAPRSTHWRGLQGWRGEYPTPGSILFSIINKNVELQYC
jgi:hypothetical protein